MPINTNFTDVLLFYRPTHDTKPWKSLVAQIHSSATSQLLVPRIRPTTTSGMHRRAINRLLLNTGGENQNIGEKAEKVRNAWAFFNYWGARARAAPPKSTPMITKGHNCNEFNILCCVVFQWGDRKILFNTRA